MSTSSTRCPICGEQNACGMAEGAETCWCFDVTIAPETLAAIPEAARGKVCVCRACARGESTRGVAAAPDPVKRFTIRHE